MTISTLLRGCAETPSINRAARMATTFSAGAGAAGFCANATPALKQNSIDPNTGTRTKVKTLRDRDKGQVLLFPSEYEYAISPTKERFSVKFRCIKKNM
jgi:hypothetical protein